jgi:eukaryotic-like serine/threonine-protein kinase
MPDGAESGGQQNSGGDGAGQAGVAGWNVPGYTGLKKLGSGGFGEVVLARHDESGTLVAIKYLRQELLADDEFAEMFRAEAAVLASIDDPHVVRLHEYVETPAGAAIVMELVEGVSLREVLEQHGETTPEAALVVLQGSLLGLAAAHARGIVHRDYKPDNVLVDGDGASKLTDFGIAVRAGYRSMPAGTLMYAPPEQIAGEPASPAGDVYAATATFFECLTGRPPYHGDTAQALLYQHISEPVPVDAVPEPVRPLVAAGMAKQPEDRPADAASFVAALNSVAAGTYGPDWHERGRSHLAEAALLLAALWPSGGAPAAQGATVVRVPLRQRPWLRPSRAIWAAIAAAVVVAGTILGVVLTSHGPAHPAALPLPVAAAPPAVTGVSPDSGSTAGGTTVTITGTGLAHATAVRFGGVAGTITADSATQVTVTSPPSASTADVIDGPGPRLAAADTVDVTVTTAAGTSHPTAADHFTYVARPGATGVSSRPAVTGVSPGSGSTAGGTTVTITGTGLAGATSVRFGTGTSTITADSSTQITVTTPRGSGTVTVTVTTPAGTSTITNADHFAYTTRPKQTQSISFTAPASGMAGGSAHLSATGGGSGNPVVFSGGSGVCTVSGTSVTFIAAGSCVIDANQAGNAQYTAAPQVQRTITVKLIPQSISFTAPASGKVRGSAHLSATGGGSGNPVRFSVASGGRKACTVSGNSVTFTGGGSCVVDANQAGNAKYAAAPQVQRTISVSKLPQSISFTAPPTGTVLSSAHLSATGGGSGNPVVFSVASSSGARVCTVSGSTVTFGAVGSCVIDANQAGNAQYMAAPQVQRTITVTKPAQHCNPGGGRGKGGCKGNGGSGGQSGSGSQSASGGQSEGAGKGKGGCKGKGGGGSG